MIIMNRTNRIRIFYATTVLSVFLCLFLGYELIEEIRINRNVQKETKAHTNVENDGSVTEEATEIAMMKAPYDYVITAEEGYLVVYKKDLETVYMYTSIRMEELPDDLQKEIETGKMFSDLNELYDFLENYSS